MNQTTLNVSIEFLTWINDHMRSQMTSQSEEAVAQAKAERMAYLKTCLLAGVSSCAFAVFRFCSF